MRCSISGSSGVSFSSSSRSVVIGRHRRTRLAGRWPPGQVSSRRAISRRACVSALPSRRAVDRVVEPAARAGGMRERDRDRVVDQVALADALGQRRAPTSALAARPPTVSTSCGRRSRSSSSRHGRRGRRSAGVGVRSPRPPAPPGVAARHGSAVERGVEASPRRARASGAASGRRGRATERPRLPRRCRAPGRRGRRAGRRLPWTTGSDSIG